LIWLESVENGYESGSRRQVIMKDRHVVKEVKIF
jgi:hypothetical protein